MLLTPIAICEVPLIFIFSSFCVLPIACSRASVNSVDRLLYLGGESRSVTSLCRQMRSKATRDDRANGSVERIVVDDSGWTLLEHWWDSGAFGDDPKCMGNRLLASVVHGVVHRYLLDCSLW